jgi:hypothetical protein
MRSFDLINQRISKIIHQNNKFTEDEREGWEDNTIKSSTNRANQVIETLIGTKFEEFRENSSFLACFLLLF